MGGPRPVRSAECAAALLKVLERFERDGITELPRLVELAAMLRFGDRRVVDHYQVHDALRWLWHHRMIAWKHGTRSRDRGHQAIRLAASGHTMKTAGCPFDAPHPRWMGRVAVHSDA